MVYFGGEVSMELALPTSPCCVSVSMRWASLVSSGGRACGVCVGLASVSSVSQDPFQNKYKRCAKVVAWDALSCVSFVLVRLLVWRSSWSMCISSFHSRAV